MIIKEYTLHKTSSKTAKENNLYTMGWNKDDLMDLSLLDNIDGVPAEEMEHIKEYVAEHHIPHDRNDVFIILYDDFTTYEVKTRFVNHHIYNKKTGSRRYRICQLAGVKINRYTRKHVYDVVSTVQEFTADNHNAEPVTDIEI